MSGRAEDLTGRVFGNLKVTRYKGKNESNRAIWRCHCKCGKYCIVEGRRLKNGSVKSCGCLQRGVPAKSEMSDRAMSQPSASLGRLGRTSIDMWQNLANAIVAVAADDYRMALQANDQRLLKSLENFFYSEWYQILTNVDASHLLKKLREEAAASQQVAYR